MNSTFYEFIMFWSLIFRPLYFCFVFRASNFGFFASLSDTITICNYTYLILTFKDTISRKQGAI